MSWKFSSGSVGSTAMLSAWITEGSAERSVPVLSRTRWTVGVGRGARGLVVETITLTGAELDRAEVLAEATFQRFKSVDGYYTNFKRSHLRAKIGEIAAARWLVERGLVIDGAFEDSSRISACDIVVSTPGVSAPGTRIEVKTWGAENWSTLGRCVAVGQFKKIWAKADIILWGTTDEHTVVLRGWSTVDDVAVWPVRMTGPAQGRKVENLQGEEEDLRPMSALLGFIDR